MIEGEFLFGVSNLSRIFFEFLFLFFSSKLFDSAKRQVTFQLNLFLLRKSERLERDLGSGITSSHSFLLICKNVKKMFCKWNPSPSQHIVKIHIHKKISSNIYEINVLKLTFVFIVFISGKNISRQT